MWSSLVNFCFGLIQGRLLILTIQYGLHWGKTKVSLVFSLLWNNYWLYLQKITEFDEQCIDETRGSKEWFRSWILEVCTTWCLEYGYHGQCALQRTWEEWFWNRGNGLRWGFKPRSESSTPVALGEWYLALGTGVYLSPLLTWQDGAPQPALPRKLLDFGLLLYARQKET